METKKLDNIDSFLQDFQALLEKYEGKISFGISKGHENAIMIVDESSYEDGTPTSFTYINQEDLLVLEGLKTLNKTLSTANNV